VLPAVLVLVDLAAGTAAGTPVRRRTAPRRAGAAIGAGVVTGVFASSVVWYFATRTGGMRGSGPVALLGADAYTLVMLGLLLLLPARRLGDARAVERDKPPAVERDKPRGKRWDDAPAGGGREVAMDRR
jgi:hypothetical protein